MACTSARESRAELHIEEWHSVHRDFDNQCVCTRESFMCGSAISGGIYSDGRDYVAPAPEAFSGGNYSDERVCVSPPSPARCIQHTTKCKASDVTGNTCNVLESYSRVA